MDFVSISCFALEGISHCWRARPVFARDNRLELDGMIVKMLVDGKGRLTNPSSRPSPVVAQLGTTYQILSFSWLSFNASVTS